MAKTAKTSIYRKGTTLGLIGFWATVWWGVSWVFILLLVWLGKDTFVVRTAEEAGNFLSNWWYAFGTALDSYTVIRSLLVLIAAGWIAGGIIWLRELKRAKISFKTALKDLFFTLR